MPETKKALINGRLYVQREDGRILIFRRYRKNPKTGEIMDARQFGHSVWPIWVYPHELAG